MCCGCVVLPSLPVSTISNELLKCQINPWLPYKVILFRSYLKFKFVCFFKFFRASWFSFLPFFAGVFNKRRTTAYQSIPQKPGMEGRKGRQGYNKMIKMNFYKTKIEQNVTTTKGVWIWKEKVMSPYRSATWCRKLFLSMCWGGRARWC